VGASVTTSHPAPGFGGLTSRPSPSASLAKADPRALSVSMVQHADPSSRLASAASGSSRRQPQDRSASSATQIMVCTPVSKVGWRTGANAGLWLVGMSSATRPACWAAR